MRRCLLSTSKQAKQAHCLALIFTLPLPLMIGLLSLLLWLLPLSVAWSLEQEQIKSAPSASLAQCHLLPEQVAQPIATLHQLESALLLIYNVQHEIQFLKKSPTTAKYLSSELHQHAVNCQIILKQSLADLLQSPSFLQLQHTLAHSTAEQAPIQSLLPLLSQLQAQQLPLAEETRFQSLQAQLLAQQHKTASLNASGYCHLTSTEEPISLRKQVARYLLQQQNPICREQVWLSYQTRLSEQNQPLLQELLAIKQQQAQQQGYRDLLSWRLADHPLKTAAGLQQFLNQHTENVGITPWDLPQYLKRHPIEFSAYNSLEFFNFLSTVIQPLGLRFEYPSHQQLQIWYQQRLLGIVELQQGTQAQFIRAQQHVLGRQLGYGLLVVPNEINGLGSQNRLIEAVSEMLARVSYVQHHYLLSHQQGRQLGQVWLKLWLTQQVNAQMQRAHAQQASLTRLAAYNKQRQVFHNKVIFNAYLPTRYDLSQEFELSFGRPLSNTNAARYAQSLPEIITEQGQSYLALWYQVQAERLLQRSGSSAKHFTKHSGKSATQIYHTLLLTEDQLSFAAQLQQLGLD